MTEVVPYLGLLAAGVYVARSVLSKSDSRKKLPLPPGPPSYPIIGQILSMPKEFEQYAFLELSKQTGSK